MRLFLSLLLAASVSFGAEISGGGGVALPVTGANGGTGVANGASSTLTLPNAATTITTGGTIALGGFTFTVPATGTGVTTATLAGGTLPGSFTTLAASGAGTFAADVAAGSVTLSGIGNNTSSFNVGWNNGLVATANGRIIVIEQGTGTCVTDFTFNPSSGATGYVDLGATARKWRDGWFSRDVSVGGTLTIGGGTAIAKVMSATATLDFGSTLGLATADLTITVTGAAVGDVVDLGVPNASIVANSSYFGWVSAADTVTVRFVPLVTGDPASGTFRAQVNHF